MNHTVMRRTAVFKQPLGELNKLALELPAPVPVYIEKSDNNRYWRAYWGTPEEPRRRELHLFGQHAKNPDPDSLQHAIARNFREALEPWREAPEEIR